MITTALKYCHYLWSRTLRHLFSVHRWVVLIKPVVSATAIESVLRAPDTVRCRKANSDDYSRIITAYPPEFSVGLPENIKRKRLLARSKQNIPCFLAESESGELLGATWCFPYSDSSALKATPHASTKVFEMVNTFVLAKHRNRGIAQQLRRFAVQCMATEGYAAVISFVWYSRAASLKMNLATGSKVLGEKKLMVIAGTRIERIKPDFQLHRLPVDASATLLLIASTPGPALSRLIRLFKNYGIRVHPMVLERQVASRGRSGRPVSSSADASNVRAILQSLAHTAQSKPLLMCIDREAEQRVAPHAQEFSAMCELLNRTRLEQSIEEPNCEMADDCGGRRTIVALFSRRDASLLHAFSFLQGSDASRIEILAHDSSLETALEELTTIKAEGLVTMQSDKQGTRFRPHNSAFDTVKLLRIADLAHMQIAATLYLDGIGKGDLIAPWQARPMSLFLK